MPVAENKRRVNATIPEETHEWLKEESNRTGATMSSIIANAIEQYIDTKEGMRFMRSIGGMSNFVDKMEEIKAKIEEEKRKSD